MPKLSFVIPIYKPRREVLKRCIKSLATQSIKDWELVAVLDGPCPEARGIIQSQMRHAHGVPCRIIEIEHGGACRARNAGYGEAQGDYLVFWDSDCYIEPDAARAWVDILDRDKTFGFVYSSYRFTNEAGAINAEPFDPWLLRVRNYISSCFPVRRELFPGWNESLESLQDWDFWLSVVEKGGVGKYLQGYAFMTELPTAESISGRGCTPEAWLGRVDAVKRLHGLPERSVCVSSLQYKADGIRLAKLLDADYQDYPTIKPHRYKTIIQVGFSLSHALAEHHALNFSDRGPKKILFWTGDNISEIWNGVSLSAIDKYSILLNSCVLQFVEDKIALGMMDRAGFKTEIMPMPFQAIGAPKPLPEKPRFAVDICGEYGEVFNVLDKCLPDVEFVNLNGTHKIEDFTGLLHFYLDRSMSSSIKRMVLAGRHVISNVQAPFAGFIDDKTPPEKFIPVIVDKVREVAWSASPPGARDYYLKTMDTKNLLEVIGT